MRTITKYFLSTIILAGALIGISQAGDKSVMDYPYKPYMEGKMDPQLTGWPLTDAEKEYAKKTAMDRRPGKESADARELPDMVPVTPAAGRWNDPEKWLTLHTELVKLVQSKKDSIDIALIGDSITYFWNTWLWDGTKIVEKPKFHDGWSKRFSKYQTVNLGIQGDTTQTILWRLDHGALDGASPKVIILMIGVNNKPSPENYKAIAQGIRLCLENLRKRCPDSNIILVKTLPAGWVLNENIHRLNDTVGEMKLDRDPKIQLLDIWDDLTNPDGTVESNIYMDGFLHVGAEGYEIWAAKLEPLINKTLNMEKSKGPYTGVEAIRGDAHPDILTVPADLELPVIGTGEPAPGKVVLQSLPAYAGTAVAHTLYLPTDWTPDKKFPVIVEYLGNTARVRDFRGIGYGLSAGRGFIWAVLPFVNPDRKSDAAWWWGDVELTVSYAKEAVPAICKKWGGNPSQVILVGSSRGAIACNYIGLHDDEIAKLWRGMIAFSHYNDAHISWGMTPEEQKRAPERLQRLGKIPQLICGEHCSIPQQGSDAKLLDALKEKNLSTFEAAKKELGLVPITEVEGTRKFISENYPQGNYTIMDLSWVNHGSNVLLRDTPERQRIRDWIRNVLQGGSYGCDEGK